MKRTYTKRQDLITAYKITQTFDTDNMAQIERLLRKMGKSDPEVGHWNDLSPALQQQVIEYFEWELDHYEFADKDSTGYTCCEAEIDYTEDDEQEIE